MANREAAKAPRSGRSNGVSNAEQLRSAIDSGETGDKVDVLDPAAAPLGSDAEAGGYVASPEEIALDAETEAANHESARNPSRELAKERRASPVLLVGALLAVLAIALVLFFLGARG